MVILIVVENLMSPYVVTKGIFIIAVVLSPLYHLYLFPRAVIHMLGGLKQ